MAAYGRTRSRSADSRRYMLPHPSALPIRSASLNQACRTHLRLQDHMLPVKPSYSPVSRCTLGKSPSLAFLPRADSPSDIPSQPLLTNHRLVAYPCSTLVAVAPPRARPLGHVQPRTRAWPLQTPCPQDGVWGKQSVCIPSHTSHPGGPTTVRTS